VEVTKRLKPSVHLGDSAPWMRVGDERFTTEAIRDLYESSDYPLRRAGAKQVSKRVRKRSIGRPEQ
jgi:hypothetical protein